MPKQSINGPLPNGLHGERPKTAAPAPQRQLLRGYLSRDESTLTAELDQHPGDDDARFALGIVQFLQAVEQLSQDLYRYGLRFANAQDVPFLRVVPHFNANPRSTEAIDYRHARGIAQRMLDSLNKAETTLSLISDPDVKLPVHFGMIRMDLTGDGRTEHEPLWKLYERITHQHFSADQAEQFYIKFDRGDVHWLRGYCHLLMTLLEVYLAYDSEETFNCTAHLFFNKVNTPYKFLTERKVTAGQDRSLDRDRRDMDQIFDFVAFVHTINWQVVEPERMQHALGHLEQVVAQSKESWKWIMAETDDDHEWLPNPRQTGVLPNMHVTQEMVERWSHMMDELGKILRGEVLVPFWRNAGGQGINVRKIFLKPARFDLVLWVQGTGMQPYLENGKITDTNFWRQLPQAFNGNFPGFAVYFN